MGASGTLIKPKKGCCTSDPRCKRCPVVLQRLAKMGVAEKQEKRYLLSKDVRKKQLKAARAR